MSFRFAAVRIAARGIPLASVMRWCLLPSLRLSTGLGPVFPPATNRANRSAVNDRPGPVDLVRGAQPGKQRGMQLLPHACLLPIPQTSPACHARTASHLLRQHLPRNAAFQHKQDAGQRLPILDRFPTGVSIPSWLGRRKQRLHHLPQSIRHKFLCHVPSPEEDRTILFLIGPLRCEGEAVVGTRAHEAANGTR